MDACSTVCSWKPHVHTLNYHLRWASPKGHCSGLWLPYPADGCVAAVAPALCSATQGSGGTCLHEFLPAFLPCLGACHVPTVLPGPSHYLHIFGNGCQWLITKQVICLTAWLQAVRTLKTVGTPQLQIIEPWPGSCANQLKDEGLPNAPTKNRGQSSYRSSRDLHCKAVISPASATKSTQWISE